MERLHLQSFVLFFISAIFLCSRPIQAQPTSTVCTHVTWLSESVATLPNVLTETETAIKRRRFVSTFALATTFETVISLTTTTTPFIFNRDTQVIMNDVTVTASIQTDTTYYLATSATQIYTGEEFESQCVLWVATSAMPPLPAKTGSPAKGKVNAEFDPKELNRLKLRPDQVSHLKGLDLSKAQADPFYGAVCAVSAPVYNCVSQSVIAIGAFSAEVCLSNTPMAGEFSVYYVDLPPVLLKDNIRRNDKK